ncbi:MAG: hypothetical protein Q8O67_30010 [Deltaproteobacteria bacterium]|nr:hypothetical protein [Deltaproteobacteria bacterium]
MKTMITALVAAVAALASTGAAALPEVVSYAARIENDAGPFDGTLSVTFQLFDASTAGALLWGENVASSVVVDGDLVHELGSIEPLDDTVLERDALFLSVTINGDTLEPRVALRAVPYALKALEAESLSGLTADDVATDDEVAAAVAARVVAFAQLSGVPAGFADNVDNDTIATAAGGGGLRATANAFSVDDNGITLARMADSSVGSVEIVNESITAADLAPNSVGFAEIANGAVIAGKLGSNSVAGENIQSNSVGSSELESNAVDGSKIRGAEVDVFIRPLFCAAPGTLVLDAPCASQPCGANSIGQTIFLTCSNVCSQTNTTADACTSARVGKLLDVLN